jgi:hypothetical protein
MFVVALTRLAGGLEAESTALAAELELAPYDVRVRFAGVLPRVVFQSVAPAEASRVLGIVRARGHDAFVCDTRSVPASGSLVRLHRFALEETCLVANDGGPRLAYADIWAILVTTARTAVVRETDDVELVTSGRGEARAVHVHGMRNERVSENAAYIFPRPKPDEGLLPPWLLHAREAQYRSLGAQMRATKHDNFEIALAILRARAPDAIYDDRFSAAGLENAQLVHVRGHESAAPRLTDAHGDLAVHLLALSLLGDRSGPYR